VRSKALHDQNYYTSLSALTSLVRSALLEDDASKSKVMAVLREARVNPKEWGAFATYAEKYTRNVVAVDSTFVALLLCWSPNQASAAHDHAGSSCWVKLLDGELAEERFDKKDVLGPKLGPLKALPPVSYMDDSLGVHRIVNTSPTRPAVSLHVYAPPFEACHVYSPLGKTQVSMVAALQGGRPPEEEHQRTITRGTAAVSLASLGQGLSLLSSEGKKGAAKKVAAEKESALLGRLDLTPEEWNEFASRGCFSAHRVARHLAFCDERYAVVVSCFGPGQRTPTYRWAAAPAAAGGTHKKKTFTPRRAWHRVLRGRVRLERGRKLLHEAGSFTFLEEEGSGDEERSLRNPDADDVAVLVSVYSPPLLKLGEDFPVAHRGACPLAAARHDVVHTNIAGLVGLLERAFTGKRGADDDDEDAKPDKVETITAILENCVLDPDEWRGYDLDRDDSFARALVAEAPQFNLFLTAWSTGNFSPVHDHDGAASWTKILEGTLDEAVYDKNLALLRSGPLAANTTTYSGPHTIHGAANTKHDACYTLTLYSPPYKHARAYYHDKSDDKSTGGCKVNRLEIPTHVWGADGHADNVSLLRPAAPYDDITDHPIPPPE